MEGTRRLQQQIGRRQQKDGMAMNTTTKVLVIHGLGMNMRGKLKTEIFGRETLAEYDARIRAAAAELGLGLEIFQSNAESEIVDRLYGAVEQGIAGVVINPAGFAIGYRGLTVAIDQVNFPVVEVHFSNPATRGIISDVGRVAAATVTGFGVESYCVALCGLKDLLARKAART
jgi:3-dehydroquinate dehydratase-2